jgi:AcrR family transcriptional regulator
MTVGRGDALRPRKQPVQARSRATYERVVEASSRILFDEGYDALSMNRITRETGVSPGTLYQYFPNRQAIALQVFDRALDELAATVFGRFIALVGEPIDIVSRTIVDLVLDDVDEHADLWRAVLNDIPRRALLDRINQIGQRSTDLTRVHLATQPARAPGNDEVAIWLLISASEGILSHYVLDPPPVPRDTIVDELMRLIQAFAGYESRA